MNDCFYDGTMNQYREVYWYNLDFILCYFCEFTTCFKIKDEIVVKPIPANDEVYPIFKLRADGTYDLYISKRVRVANCCYANFKITNIKLYNDDDLENTPYFLFGLNEAEEDKLKYYKYYFWFMQSIDQEVYFNEKNCNKISSFGKYKAMAFYFAVKRAFEEDKAFQKNSYIVSEPNVFIRGHHIEYDFLLLRKGTAINQGFYDFGDVIATVELKTSPMRISSEEIVDYLNNEIYQLPCVFIVGYDSFVHMKKISEVPEILPFCFCNLNKVNGKRKYYISDDAINHLGMIVEKISLFHKSR